MSCILFLCPLLGHAQDLGGGFGQTIQINTRFHSYVGTPSWLLIIRDLDHNQNIPYLFDIRRGTNFFLAFTYSRNYVITVSNMQFSPLTRDPYFSRRINNFCHLESQCRVMRGRSLYVTIEGHLSPNPNTFRCHVVEMPNTNFTIVSPENLSPT